MINGLDAELRFTNSEAEKHIVGGIILDPELIDDCYIKPEHLYDPRNKNLLYIMQELKVKNVPIEVVAIIERAAKANAIEKIGGLSYVSEIAAAIPTTASFDHYQGIILDYYKRRKTIEAAQALIANVMSEEGDTSRAKFLEDIANIENEGDNSQDTGHISDVLSRVYDWMEQDHGEISGASTGFVSLDRQLNGWQKQDLVIIGARPSMGKTAFANNIVENHSIGTNNPSVIFSLEMKDEGIVKRMISSVGHIDGQKMRNPLKNFESADWERVANLLGPLGSSPIYIRDTPGVDINYIYRESKKIKKMYPNEHMLVVVDYLQLIVGDRRFGGNRTAEISDISRKLKQLARDLDCTVIALSQLSRKVEERQDKRPMMSDLRESGQIEQDADIIAFLYRDDYYNKDSEEKNITEIIIAKQRQGGIGTVKMAFKKEISKFLDLEFKQN